MEPFCGKSIKSCCLEAQNSKDGEIDGSGAGNMGISGMGPFDNDEAAHWLDKLVSQKTLKAVGSALKRATQSEIPDTKTAILAVAAAETLAAIGGKPAKRTPSQLKEWVQANEFSPEPSLTSAAHQALRKILAESELPPPWENHASWSKAIQALLKRLPSEQEEPAQPKTSAKPPAGKASEAPKVETTRHPTMKPAPKWVISKLRKACDIELSENGDLIGILSYGRITDEEMELIGKAGATLEEVALMGCANITNDGLDHLKSLSQVKKLRIQEAPQITNDGMEFLRELKTLTKLVLGFNPTLSSAGLEPLKNLVSLEELELNFTRVSDTGLKWLTGLTCLKMLNLRGTKVSREGVNALRKTLPGLVEIKL